MSQDVLFEPLTAGALATPNRIWMAPLTRSRARQPGDVPWELNAEYYVQRASAGLIIAEASQVSPQGKGYPFTPGIHTDAQVEGWRKVTDAVHAAGGRIALQLWHVGRVSRRELQPGGGPPVAPSRLRAASMTWLPGQGMVPVDEPREIERWEVPGLVEQFREAARRAQVAGFDGVEIHGANGYLLDQFTRDGTNRRTDAYGGSVANRLRFPLMVVDAVVDVWGPDRVGYRISPESQFNDMADSNPTVTFGELARRLSERHLAFIDVVESFGRAPRGEAAARAVRAAFRGVYVGNGNYGPDVARARIEQGKADAIAFGTLYISNPDLPERIRRAAPLTPADPTTFYGGGARGYTDYPALRS